MKGEASPACTILLLLETAKLYLSLGYGIKALRAVWELKLNEMLQR